MCGHTRGEVIYSKFYQNPFRGFGTPGGQDLAFPITLASRFYNSLYYRTSRDPPSSVQPWVTRPRSDCSFAKSRSLLTVPQS